MQNKTILITGGTGSLGQHLVKHILESNPKKVIVFSRDEHKQVEMERILKDKRIRFFIGDIRDRDRLYYAFQNVDIIIHCAALKQVPKCEYSPFEAIKTNVLGAQNIIDVAIKHNIKRVLAISTDKAVAPLNLYGATKLCADRLFIAASAYVGDSQTRFSVIRFGNFAGSRGSVIPLFKRLKAIGDTLPITDKRMTRFFISLDAACECIFKALEIMRGGEIFIPKMPSMKITDLAKSISPKTKEIGIRVGEKIHEDLILNADAINTYEYNGFFITYPDGKRGMGKKVESTFCYNSENNWQWIEDI